jgi:hypothetical protein
MKSKGFLGGVVEFFGKLVEVILALIGIVLGALAKIFSRF